MEVKFYTKISNGSLVTVQNILPISVSVASAYNTKVYCDVYHTTNYADINSTNRIATNLEMLLKEKHNSTGIYYIELSSILLSAFSTNINDKLQSAENWLEIPELLEDFVITFTATNGVESDSSNYLEITCLNASRQFGQNGILITQDEVDATADDIISTADRKVNTDDKIYCQAGNVVYVYALISDDSAVVTESYDDDYFFVDYDGTFLTDYEDAIYHEVL